MGDADEYPTYKFNNFSQHLQLQPPSVTKCGHNFFGKEKSTSGVNNARIIIILKERGVKRLSRRTALCLGLHC